MYSNSGASKDGKTKYKRKNHGNKSVRNKLAHCLLFMSASINFKRLYSTSGRIDGKKFEYCLLTLRVQRQL